MCEYVYIRSSVSGFNAKQILLLNYDLEVYGLANIKSTKNIIKNRLSMNKWGNYAYYDIRAYKRK